MLSVFVERNTLQITQTLNIWPAKIFKLKIYNENWIKINNEYAFKRERYQQ